MARSAKVNRRARTGLIQWPSGALTTRGDTSPPLEFRSKWAHEALTRENMSSWAHARTPYAQAFVQFRADQARSCAYKLRNSGCRLLRFAE